MSDIVRDSEHRVNRRRALHILGLASAGGLLAAAGCAKQEAAPPPPSPTPAPPAPAPAAPPAAATEAAPAAAAPAGTETAAAGSCDSAAPIDDASKTMRRALQYKEKSDFADKNCGGCVQYEAAKYGACGACKLFTGAVAPGGHCLSYAPKQA